MGPCKSHMKNVARTSAYLQSLEVAMTYTSIYCLFSYSTERSTSNLYDKFPTKTKGFSTC